MKVLVVDDEESILETTSLALENLGHQPSTARTRRQALKQLQEDQFDVVFLDLRLGRDNGLDILDEIVTDFPQLSVIIFTAYSSLETAIAAIKRGAWDYIQKPFLPEQIGQMLDRLKQKLELQRTVEALESKVETAANEASVESKDPSMQSVYSVAFKAAQTDAPILILGASGSGKTVLAETIHRRSRRSEKEVVTVHCPSLSRELLESELFGHVKGAFTGATRDTWGKVSAAEGGTLFLDEIGELTPEIQPKLLRLLQSKEYERVGEARTRVAEVRIIAATNRDLKQEVEAGRFREDLYYRLNVISVTMPPLKDRPDDIRRLSERFVAQLSQQHLGRKLRLSPSLQKRLMAYPWPGNVRELKNAIERCVILSSGDIIDEIDLPGINPESDNGQKPSSENHIEAALPLEASLAEVEEAQIRRVLAASNSLDEAAKTLGVDKVTLYRKRKKLGLA